MQVSDWDGIEDPMRKVVDLTHWAYFFMAEEDRNRLDAWMVRGKCFGKGELTEAFNPPVDDDDGTPSKTARIITIEAKKYCGGAVDGFRCPVKRQCLDYAIEQEIHFGVWGGATVRERRRIATQRAKKKGNKK
jgi:hypothetical protein